MFKALFITLCLASGLMAGALTDAQRYYDEGKVAEALEQFEMAAVRDANEVTLLYNLANCHYKLDQPDEAMGLFERVLAQESDSALASKAHFNLGNCFFQQAISQEQAKLEDVLKGLITAVKHFREALRIDPDDSQARHNIALVSSVMAQIIEQIQQQQEQEKQDQQQQEDLAKKIEELLERQTDLLKSSNAIDQAQQMAMVDPNFIVDMRQRVFPSQVRLKEDSSQVQGEVSQMVSQSQEGGDSAVYETVHQEMGLAVNNQAEAAAGLGQGQMVRAIADQTDAAQHLQNALDAIKKEQDEQQQQQGDDQQDQQDSEKEQEQQQQEDQEGENSENQQKEQEQQEQGKQSEEPEKPGQQGQEQEAKPLDQTAQEILDKEKERQEQKRKVILRGGGGVEKNW